MKPIINIEDIAEFKSHDNGAFKAQYADVGGKIGANQLGYNITIIPPGKKSWQLLITMYGLSLFPPLTIRCPAAS